MTELLKNPLAVVMVIIMIILVLIIALLANLLLGAANVYVDKLKEKETSKKKSPSLPVFLLGGLLLSALSGAAQDAKTAASSIGGMRESTFYIMSAIIFLEIIVILGLLINVRILLAKDKKITAPLVAIPAGKPTIKWWNKINRFKPVAEEVQIDLGHNYDGIRELDNKLPPWWLYGFYLTILFAAIYLWRFHVSHSAPGSLQEFQYAMQVAAEQKEEYLRTTAAKVDENSVKLLSAAADLQSGQTIFQSNCAPCHGKLGEGMVGPNLTDDYWLHGGDIKEIFKTIKYGVPEKGMKSWKEDFSPVQIAQLTSYIKSLSGTHPPNAKEKQGDLYREQSKKDSVVKVIAAN